MKHKYIDTLLSEIQLLESKVANLKKTQHVSFSFFKESFKRTQEISRLLHELEFVQIEDMKGQMERLVQFLSEVKEVKVETETETEVEPMPIASPIVTPIASPITAVTPVEANNARSGYDTEEIVTPKAYTQTHEVEPKEQKVEEVEEAEELVMEEVEVEIQKENKPVAPRYNNQSETYQPSIQPSAQTTIHEPMSNAPVTANAHQATPPPVRSIVNQQKETIVENLGVKNRSLNDVQPVNQTIQDAKRSISLNDRFLFQRELFNNNREAMNVMMTNLQPFTSFEAIENYLKENTDWNFRDETVDKFMQMLKDSFK